MKLLGHFSGSDRTENENYQTDWPSLKNLTEAQSMTGVGL